MQLRLQRTAVTDAGLAHLKNLTTLKLLFLDETNVSDAGMKHLAGLRWMRHLYLGSTQVTDAGIVHFKGMGDLFALGLQKTKTGDAGLKHLVGLRGFARLYLSDTQVSDAALKNPAGRRLTVPRRPTRRLAFATKSKHKHLVNPTKPMIDAASNTPTLFMRRLLRPASFMIPSSVIRVWSRSRSCNSGILAM